MSTNEVTAENYFDVYEACYTWLSLNHEGQWSPAYELLCKSEFNPGPMWSEHRVVDENPYYGEITRENVEELVEELMEAALRVQDER